MHITRAYLEHAYAAHKTKADPRAHANKAGWPACNNANCYPRGTEN